MDPKPKTECPYKELLNEKRANADMSAAYHQLANECEKMMAQLGNRRGMRRVFYKCYFSQNRTGRFISWFNNGPISHVSFIFPKATDVGKTMLWEIEADSKAGVIEHPHDVDTRKGDYRYIDCTIEECRKMSAFAMSLVGKKYDKPGILGFVTRTRMEDPDKWFCSELLAAVTASGDHPLSYRHPATVNPTDCWASVGGTPCPKEAVTV